MQTIVSSHFDFFLCRDEDKDEPAVIENVTQENIRVRRKEGYAAAEKRLNTKTTDVCFVEEHDIIGEFFSIFFFFARTVTKWQKKPQKSFFICNMNCKMIAFYITFLSTILVST